MAKKLDPLLDGVAAVLSPKKSTRKTPAKSPAPASPAPAKSSPAKSSSPARSNLVQRQAQGDVAHGLNITQADPNSILPGKLDSVSSGLAATPKAEADKAVEQVEQQRQTLRVMAANVDLQKDALSLAKSQRQVEAGAIQYATEGLKVDTAGVGYQSAAVDLEIAQSKLAQRSEVLAQKQIELAGTVAATPLIQQQQHLKTELLESKNASLKTAIQSVQQRLQEQLQQLEGDAE
jgi:hypothetical protein